MKLGTEMDTQKAAKYAKSEEPTVKTEATNRHFKIAIVALVSLIVVGAIVISAVFIGGKLAKDAIKEAAEFKYTFHTTDGRTIEETIALTDTEEDIGLKDGTHIVYDYSKGFLVMKVTEDGKVTCYVTSFERKDIHAPAPEAFSSMDHEQNNISMSDETDYYVDKSITLDPAILSKRSRDMCAGGNIYWMSEDPKHDGEGDRHKRGFCTSWTWYCYPTYPWGVQCRWICRF